MSEDFYERRMITVEVSDYVSKSELRAWCEKNLINEFYTVSLEDSFAGHHINRVLKVIIEKFCKEEEV